ncbi:sensitivity to high expression protein she10 [Maudiozyma exigua]|uniref:Sensitivity to high expression protein she10 n=1 Tax=Maudiozyma exigua TaxID=34358 RepID=A0A9P7BCG3_MAUEX|nr:sensitivity to high expression protein she10 [Kazachstania exigua]
MKSLSQLTLYVTPIICQEYRTIWSHIKLSIAKLFCHIWGSVDCWCKRNHHCTKLHLKVASYSRVLRWLQFYFNNLTEKLLPRDKFHWLNNNGIITVVKDTQQEEEYEEEEDKEIHSSKWLDMSVYDDINLEEEITRDFELEVNKQVSLNRTTSNIDSQRLFDDIIPYLNETNLIEREFHAWSLAITHKLQSSISNLHRDNTILITNETKIFNDTLSESNNIFAQNIQQQINDLSSDISDIDSSTTLDPETNEIIYMNSQNIYISRPYITTKFDSLQTDIKQFKQDTLHALKQLRLDILSQLESQRQEYIEVYEEWGDIMVTEWSKRMAYGDIYGNQPERFELDKWHHFSKLKQNIIGMRDSIVNEPLDQDPLVQFMKDIIEQINTVLEQYHTVIRSLIVQANTNFDQRDSRERNITDHLADSIARSMI